MLFFFFNDTATTEIYTLSLHDALPICGSCGNSSTSASWTSAVGTHTSAKAALKVILRADSTRSAAAWRALRRRRSEEHTSELQSRQYLVCRLLLEKKKK